ncbi:hypothetical protein [Sabulicella glaciei]|uniref:Uncharacterized protein n=1 Tax=Sabulicella glaciei TaxID=2984948 RepID=A0ABT3NQ26_9PROT|nr:hypothetical protein [Roseococcus sp. MDT2-1-1]MCW8084267.1 hypothetical protein [Roseococcus sp. MDT2-1-1]
MSASPDRLYELLPDIYRLRDADRGYPLREMLRVVAEQLEGIEADIDQLYDNWFVETAADWAVPYIAELVGYTAVNAAGDPTTSAPAENRILVPRREVANTLAFRRRRGTLSVHEDLAAAVTGWPSRAVELFRRLAWSQNLNFPHNEGHRARTVSFRSAAELERINTPFDPFAHTADLRRITSRRGPGLHNVPSVGLWVWRLKPYTVTGAPAYCLDEGKNSYSFSVLGNDVPLVTKPELEPSPTHIATEFHVPAPIRRRAFAEHPERYYGADKSFVIAADWGGHTHNRPLPLDVIIPADLTDWAYTPPNGFVAVDPQLGRIQFPANQLPRRQVRVSYRYAFSDDMGAGEYARVVSQPPDAVIYRVGERQEFRELGDALGRWRSQDPRSAVIEITDSRAYVEQVAVKLAPGQSLQIRAADRKRPTLRLLNWQTDRPDTLQVTLGETSSFLLDGLLITGRGVTIMGDPETRGEGSPCGSHVEIRHCTLVPGWSLDAHCNPARMSKESLELRNVRAHVRIASSILGPIEVHEDEVLADPIPLTIEDSIVDAMGGEHEAIIGPDQRHAHAVLTIRRTTVFGIVQLHAVQLAENSIFNDCVHVARRQIGCMRFCYVPAGCRTPRRYNCQPDLVVAAAVGEADKALEARRATPQFTARRYATPAYGQLADTGPREIATGADDGAEMGAFHNLFQPQRLANLRTRLEEFTPAGMDAGVLLAN